MNCIVIDQILKLMKLIISDRKVYIKHHYAQKSGKGSSMSTFRKVLMNARSFSSLLRMNSAKGTLYSVRSIRISRQSSRTILMLKNQLRFSKLPLFLSDS